jgi:hypothetical protein
MTSLPDTLTRLAAPLAQATDATAVTPNLWLLLIAGYGVLIIVLAGYAAHVSLSHTDARHRADAYKVLKLVWGTATGTTGLLAAALHLTHTGLL